MRIRVADYIASFLADYGIEDVFSVVGGGAMHLNNAFAMEKRLRKTYNHHEQACAIAAESYSRINNRIAAVCVTSGPGGTNALTGVLCAWQDSLPLIVISGQVRNDITVDSTHLNLRQFGEQEYYIVRSVEPMTKYAVIIKDPYSIRYHLEKALYEATNGRRGPVWIDVPLDIQGYMIDPEQLEGYYPTSTEVKMDEIQLIADELRKAKKPVIIAGSGVRTSGSLKDLHRIAEKSNTPIICPTSTVDYFTMESRNYFGMFGTFGGRAGNFIVQNADLLVVLGARLSFKQIGFNYEMFSPNSRKIVVDADEEELKKPSVSIDIPIWSDIEPIMAGLATIDLKVDSIERNQWFEYCCFLKNELKDYDTVKSDVVSAKNFTETFLKKAPKDTIVVLGNNTAAVSMLQSGIKQQGQRMYGNVNCGTMGYDLPAAIGAARASNQVVYCATGEGSMQMNLQELQTMVYNDLPIRIIVFNNNRYAAIVQTHTNFFNGLLAGCSKESGISFPDLRKIADAYGFEHKRIDKSIQVEEAVDWILSRSSRAILEIEQNEVDPIVPKLSSKRNDDGSIVSSPIDDLAPFMSEKEYESYQFESYIRSKQC